MRFDSMIAFHAAAAPERPAMIMMDRVVTYGMLERGIASVERHLLAAGVRRGNLAGILIENPIRHLTIALALFRQGIASISLRGPDEATLGLLGVAVLVAEPTADARLPASAILVADDWFAGTEPVPRPPPFGDEESYRIALSSGTTGRPKPVWFTPLRTERRLPAYLFALGGGYWQRIVCSLGLSTGWGFHVALTALCFGKTLVCAASARETLQMISLFRVDCLVASTHQVRTLLECQEESFIPTTSLGLLYIAGSAASRAFFAAAQARLCANIVSCYGSTEIGTVAIAPVHQLPETAGATGFVVPWVEAEAVDDNDSALPRGAEGTLRLRSSHQAHFAGPPGSGDALPWFYPGDRGAIRADGMLFITGRVSELINVGGVKIAPDAIEEVLLSHRAVRDAAVIGIAGRDGIEEMLAVVVPREAISEAELLRWCAERLPKTPIRRLRFVEMIPRNATGKTVRAEVRALLGIG